MPCGLRRLAVDLEVQVFDWGFHCHSSWADQVDDHLLVFGRNPAADVVWGEGLFVPVGQIHSKSCSALDLVTSGVFELSLFVLGQEGERRQRYCEKRHLVDILALADCHSLYSWVHNGAPPVYCTPSCSVKRWRSSSRPVCAVCS